MKRKRFLLENFMKKLQTTIFAVTVTLTVFFRAA
jgi:hypothetical protein